ncbi:MAG: radical SAM protein, partial [Nannocystaceae bacterium]
MNKSPPIPIAVNFHLYKPCNYRCRFCFATYRDIQGRLDLASAFTLLRQLREAGTEKINFAGGEPTLHPDIGDLLEEARRLGFVTALITNGARLDGLLDGHANAIDWIGISVDSGDEDIRALGIGLKLNTVVTALNWQEQMHDLVRTIQPARWKVFQVLPIEGQNDGDVEPLLITTSQFRNFVERHTDLTDEGFGPVAEDNDAMTDSYAMIDPLGRFYG